MGTGSLRRRTRNHSDRREQPPLLQLPFSIGVRNLMKDAQGRKALFVHTSTGIEPCVLEGGRYGLSRADNLERDVVVRVHPRGERDFLVVENGDVRAAERSVYVLDDDWNRS